MARIKTIDEKLKLIREIADRQFDGHFMIMSFTTCYQGCFGTLNLYTEHGLQRLHQLPKYPDLDSLLDAMIDSALLETGKTFDAYD